MHYLLPPLLTFAFERTLVSFTEPVSNLGGPESLLDPAGKDGYESRFLAEPANPFSGISFPDELGSPDFIFADFLGVI